LEEEHQGEHVPIELEEVDNESTHDNEPDEPLKLSTPEVDERVHIL